MFFVLLNHGVDQAIEQVEDIRIAQGGNAGFGDQHHIDRGQIAVSMPEYFAAQTFNTVALNCYARILL